MTLTGAQKLRGRESLAFCATLSTDFAKRHSDERKKMTLFICLLTALITIRIPAAKGWASLKDENEELRTQMIDFQKRYDNIWEYCKDLERKYKELEQKSRN